MKKKRVLIIDHANFFLRYYIVDPSLSQNGEPIGGLQGTMKGLQKIIRETKPDKVVICWDGPGGSRKRKLLNKQYKEGRSPIRLNWNSNMMSEDDKHDNKVWQLTRLSEYYDEMPVVQLLFEDIEADDLIAAVCSRISLKGWQKVIVSSDKDFIQLLDDETVLMRPVQKEVLNKKRVVEQYGILPSNFALARAIAGDKSDNLDGIGGIGLKTISSKLDFLGAFEEYSLNEFFEVTFKNLHKVISDSKPHMRVYEKILDNRNLIEENYKMMQLYSPNVSIGCLEKVQKALDNTDLTWNKTKMRVMMIRDGFGVFNWDEMERAFNRIVNNK